MPQVSIDGQIICYEEHGAGPPLLLIHGFPLDSRMWAEQMRVFAGRRAIAPDLPGFGRSPSTRAYSVAELGELMHRLLRELDARPAVVGGLSMGGYVAMALMARHPHDVAGLVLIDTRSEADSPDARAGRMKMIQTARESGANAVAEQMIPRLLAPQTLQSRPAVVAAVREMAQGLSATTIENTLLALRDREDYSGLLSTVRVPALIVVGEHDAITPPAVARSMHERLAGSTLEVIQGAGHLSPMEQPEAVNRAMARFLERGATT
jgi:3-oxoadipate enol-lactonase